MGIVVNQMRSYQFRKNSSRLRKALTEAEALRRPLEVVALASALYTGTPMNIRLSDETALVASTDVRNRRGNLLFDSNLVRGSFDFVARAPLDRDPNAPLPLDPLQREERYRFSLSRGLGVWDLSSGLSYGSSTKSLGASLNKQILPNLSTSIGTTRFLRDGSPGEESIRFSYGLTF
jgi:hypothetical protein